MKMKTSPAVVTLIFISIFPVSESAISKDRATLREASGVYRDRQIVFSTTDNEGTTVNPSSATIRIPVRGKGVARGSIRDKTGVAPRVGWSFRIKKVNCSARKVVYKGKVRLIAFTGTFRAVARKKGTRWILDVPILVKGADGEGPVTVRGRFKGQGS